MTTDAGAPGAPRFDVVLRGYDRRQVDEHVARLQRVLSRMRSDLEVARSQPLPVVPSPGQQATAEGRPRPTPRPRPGPGLPSAEPPDMIGSFTDRMQSILQAAEEEAAEIRSRARAAARAEEEHVRGQVMDLVRQRDALLGELTRMRGQLEGLLAAPTARMNYPPRSGAPAPGRAPSGPTQPGPGQRPAAPFPGARQGPAPSPNPERGTSSPSPSPSPGPRPGRAASVPGGPTTGGPSPGPGRDTQAEPVAAGSPATGGSTPGAAPTKPAETGSPVPGPPKPGPSRPESAENGAPMSGPAGARPSKSEPEPSKNGLPNGRAAGATNGSASTPSGRAPSTGSKPVASPTSSPAGSERGSDPAAKPAAHRLSTGAYPAVGEQSASMRPRTEPEPEPGDLFRPAVREVREPRTTAVPHPDPADGDAPSDRTALVPTVGPATSGTAPAPGASPRRAGDVEETVKVSAVRPAGADATVMTPATDAGADQTDAPEPEGAGGDTRRDRTDTDPVAGGRGTSGPSGAKRSRSGSRSG
jgi:hypothetical protein